MENNKKEFRVGIFNEWKEEVYEVLMKSIDRILKPLPGVVFEVLENPKDEVAKLEDIDKFDALFVLSVKFEEGSLKGAKRLACLSRWGVGFDRIDAKKATENDVVVMLTGPAVRRSVAEACLTFILALSKNLLELDKRVRAGLWRPDTFSGIEIKGKTLGTIGVGNIGGEICRMARAVGMGKIIAYDPFLKQYQVDSFGVELKEFEDVLKESDFLLVNVPLTPKTKGMIGEKQLSLMKNTSYIINTARGPIIQEKALYEALKNKVIAGAGLDVFEDEPPTKDNPLFSLDNVILTPHSIAWTKEIIYKNTEYACNNVRDIYFGRNPRWVANRAVFDRDGFKNKLQQYKSNFVVKPKSTSSNVKPSPGIQPNNLKKCILEGKVSVGTMVSEFTRSRGIAQITEQTGVDFVVIDMEHSGYDLETVADCLTRYQSTGVSALVRVPFLEYHFIARILDAGAKGVMIANVKTEEEAKKVVECAKYAPLGKRGLGLGGAHNLFRFPEDPKRYLKEANDMTVIICQIESQEGVDNSDKIAAVEGVDCLWIGHFDMTSDMGILAECNHPKFLKGMETVVAAGKKHKKGLGIQPNSLVEAKEWIEKGFNVISWSIDFGIYKTALRNSVAEVRSLLQ